MLSQIFNPIFEFILTATKPPWYCMTRISFWSIIWRAIHVMDQIFCLFRKLLSRIQAQLIYNTATKLGSQPCFVSNLDTISLISTCIQVTLTRKKVKFNKPNWLAVRWVARWPTYEIVLKPNLIFSSVLSFIWLSLSPLFCLTAKNAVLANRSTAYLRLRH